MLCLPALTPVANDAHAVGDSGECVVSSGCRPPPRWRASACSAACLRPSSVCDELRIHAVEAEDDELLLELLRRRGRVPHATAVPRQTSAGARESRFTACGECGNYNIWRSIRWADACPGHRRRRAARRAGDQRRVADAGAAADDVRRSTARPTPSSASCRRDRRLAAEDDGLAAIVVGLPARLDGSPTDADGRASPRSSTALRTRTSLPIVDGGRAAVEPRSGEPAGRARARLAQAEAKLDAAAAAIILQDYLDRQRRTEDDAVRSCWLFVLLCSSARAAARRRVVYRARQRAVSRLRRRRAVRRDSRRAPAAATIGERLVDGRRRPRSR